MICFMFPGQPVAFSDMPLDNSGFGEIADICRQVSGFNLSSSDEEPSSLTGSVRLQLFGVAMSMHRCRVLLSQGSRPDIIAEHSLGIYPALAASGAIDAAAAFALTCRIGSCLATMGEKKIYALGCVIGFTEAPLQAIASNNGVYVANQNTSKHFLLAGEREKITGAMAEAEATGAFSTSIFNCDAPLHTPLIEEIAVDLQKIVDEISFAVPEIPVMEHIGQTILTADRIPDFLVEELCRPVFWDKTYTSLRNRGVKRFIEAGAGNALAKFNRWMDSET